MRGGRLPRRAPDLQGRIVNLVARAEIQRKTWEPLEQRAQAYEQRELPSRREHGGQLVLVAIAFVGCAGTTRQLGCVVPGPTAVDELMGGLVATLVVGSVVAAGYVAIGGEAPLR